jgi:dTDP-glucose 4,6-dehydratase
VSTDEVYGHVGQGATPEDAPLRPRNPYSASKAGAELLAFSYHANFGVPVVVTRGENTIGPYQYPEKATPLFITNALEDRPLPVYGEGQAVRHYVYVDDHAAAIDLVLREGRAGEVYNVGGDERENLELAERILELTGADRSLVRHVADRAGHDRRYALDDAKLRALGWAPRWSFEDGLPATVEWYRDHRAWWEPIKSGEFREYYVQQYGARLRT